MKKSIIIFLAVSTFLSSGSAGVIKCQKQAEEVAKKESKKRNNLPQDLITIANPTKMDGENIVVYIGARANYNYFKIKMDNKCNLEKIVDVEYAE